MRALVVLALVAAAGCKKKQPEPAAEPSAPKKAQITAEIPEGAEARAFAEKLVANGLQDINPTGSSDFSMTLEFRPDGHYAGKGHAELGGETLDCEETGTWRIEEMVDGKARVEWTIVRTNCPNRDGGSSDRALVGFAGKEASVSFR